MSQVEYDEFMSLINPKINASNVISSDADDGLYCAISLENYTNESNPHDWCAVKINDKFHIYKKESIHQWLKTKNVNPITKQPLTLKDLIDIDSIDLTK